MDPTDWLSEALHGPMRLRFLVQPLLALLLGLRDGRRDHADGRPAFLVDLLTTRPGRVDRLRAALHQMALPLFLAVVLDAIIQFVLLGRIHPGVALLVGALLIALPYSVARGVTNRLLGHPRRPRPA